MTVSQKKRLLPLELRWNQGAEQQGDLLILGAERRPEIIGSKLKFEFNFCDQAPSYLKALGLPD